MKKFSALSAFTLSALFFSTPSFAAIKGYRCTGTEPFWDLQISGNQLIYNNLSGKLHQTQVQGPLTAAGTVPGYASIYVSGNRSDVVAITSQKCSDGMSDVEYANTVLYMVGNRVLFGCCEPLSQD